MQERKITQGDLERACNRLETMDFFPKEQRSIVMEELLRMAPCAEALEWTVSHAVARSGKWPGLAELRGLLCQEFTPADGIVNEPRLPQFEEYRYAKRLRDEAALEAEEAARKATQRLIEDSPEYREAREKARVSHEESEKLRRENIHRQWEANRLEAAIWREENKEQLASEAQERRKRHFQSRMESQEFHNLLASICQVGPEKLQ
jgi:DNA polymerase III delta prime subunit